MVHTNLHSTQIKNELTVNERLNSNSSYPVHFIITHVQDPAVSQPLTVASSAPGDTKAANSLATPVQDIRRNSDGGAALVASEKTSLPVSASLDQQVAAQGLGAGASAELLVDNRQPTPSSAPCEPSSSDPALSPWRSWTRHSISASCPEQTLSGQPSLQPGYSRKASCASQNSRQETRLEVDAVDEAGTQQRSRHRGSSLRGQRFLGYDGRQRADSASDSEEGQAEVFRGRGGGGQIRRHSFRVPRPSNGYEVTQPQPTWTSNRPPPPPLPPSHQGWGGDALHVSSDRLINIR